MWWCDTTGALLKNSAVPAGPSQWQKAPRLSAPFLPFTARSVPEKMADERAGLGFVCVVLLIGIGRVPVLRIYWHQSGYALVSSVAVLVS